MDTVEEWRPEVVVTDFEPLSGIYARSSRTPLVCVDNIHMIDRCRHDEQITAGARGLPDRLVRSRARWSRRQATT